MFLYTFQTENLTHAQKQHAAPQKRPLAVFAEGHPSPQLPSADLPPQLWQQLALSPWLLSPWLLEYPALRSLAADACLLYWHYSPHRLPIHRSPPHPPPPPAGQTPPPASYLQCQGAQSAAWQQAASAHLTLITDIHVLHIQFAPHIKNLTRWHANRTSEAMWLAPSLSSVLPFDGNSGAGCF